MVTDFQERLRQIREAKDRELQDRKQQQAARGSDRTSALELRMDHRRNVEKIIQEYADRFMSEVPSFSLSKSFFEGKYKLELRCEDVLMDDEGRVEKYFSRITFLIDPRPAQNTLALTCKKTVLNRDQEGTSSTVDVSKESLANFREFLESQFCDFAAVYFSGQYQASSN